MIKFIQILRLRIMESLLLPKLFKNLARIFINDVGNLFSAKRFEILRKSY